MKCWCLSTLFRIEVIFVKENLTVSQIFKYLLKMNTLDRREDQYLTKANCRKLNGLAKNGIFLLYSGIFFCNSLFWWNLFYFVFRITIECLLTLPLLSTFFYYSSNLPVSRKAFRWNWYSGANVVMLTNIRVLLS